MSMHPDCERIMLTEEQLKNRVRQVALEVDKEYENKKPLVLGILKGSIIAPAFSCKTSLPLLKEPTKARSHFSSRE